MSTLHRLFQFFGDDPSFFVMFLLSVVFLTATALIIVFYILKPLRRLVDRARGLYGSVSGGAVPAVRDEIQFITETFRALENDLREKDLKLQELYERERERAESLERYTRHLLENLSSGLLFFDTDFRLQTANPAAFRMLGLDPAPGACLGRTCGELLGAGSRWSVLLTMAYRDRQTVIEEELCLRPGIWVRISTSTVLDPDGRVLGCTFIFNDVSVFKAVSEQAARQKNLAAMGEMVAGLAHELRNPLAALKGFAALLDRKIPARDARKKISTDVLAEADILGRVMNNFLDFAKPGARESVLVDLSEPLGEALEALETMRKKKKVRLVRSAASGAKVKGDPLRLRQAFHNLMLNALESMPRGGTLSVRVSVLRPGIVSVEVRDTGRGLDPEAAARAFDLFFSTKPGGTGLGLPLVQRIVQEHGGTVSLESVPGRGTQVRVEIPKAG